MKYLGTGILSIAILALLAVGGQSQEKDKDKGKTEEKTVTLKGSISCSKCELGETPECGHFIKVKEGDKEVVYLFIDKGAKESFHAKVCKAVLKGSVTGVVSEKDKKKMITPAKDGVKFD